jgi:hypothetical protein
MGAGLVAGKMVSYGGGEGTKNRNPKFQALSAYVILLRQGYEGTDYDGQES